MKFNIRIQVVGAEKYKVKPSFSVFRFETDFYILRNILALSYTQCFIPPLTPGTKETVFDKKSLLLRERSFSRFLRGIIRSPELLNHPLVLEFLTVDHKKDKDLKEFTRKLQTKEQQMLKEQQAATRKAGALDPPFHITSYKGDKIIIEKEFLEQELINEKIERSKKKKFDEGRYIMRYEQHLAQLLGNMNKFKTQIDELKEANARMAGKLNQVKELHQNMGQPEMEYLFDCLQTNFESGMKKQHHSLDFQNHLLQEHFGYQQQIVTQSIKPFVNLIPQFNTTYKNIQKNFIKKRHKMKEEMKKKPGVGIGQME